LTKYYYRLCKSLEDYGSFYPIERNPYEEIKNLNTDIYKSIFFYTQEQVDEATKVIKVRKNGIEYSRPRGVGRITDVDGNQYPTLYGVTNQLVWDFDSADNEQARKDARDLCNNLIQQGVVEEAIQICFSGNKGFSVVVGSNQLFNADEVKQICMNLAAPLKTKDSKVYNDSRVFRLPLTRHQTTGHYKIPITLNTLRSYNAKLIKESAKNNIDPKEIDGAWITVDLPKSVIALKEVKTKEKSVDVEFVQTIQDLDFANRPRFLPPAKFVLHQGFILPGERHHSFMILAATFKKEGFTRTDAYNLLKGVAERQATIYEQEPFSENEIWDNILETVYSDSWQGGTFGMDHPILQKINEALPDQFKYKDSKGLVVGGFIFDQFEKFAVDIDKNTLSFGIKALDNKIKLLAGTSVGILGVPGSSKTSLAIELLENNSVKGEQSIFFSLDMNESLIALKLIQRATKLTNDEIFGIVKSHPLKFKELREQAMNPFRNVNYSFKYGSSPAEIRQSILDLEQKTGKKVRLVVVDYLENVQSGYSDPTVGAGMVAQQLANIAADLNVLIVILLQTQKDHQPGSPILSMRSIKGASVIEQSLSVAIGIHREGQVSKYADYDQFLDVNILKNRFGALGHATIGWDGPRSRFYEMGADDKLKYQDLLDIKKADKETDEKEKNRW
jgi:KaiC/GvpD/RAD55 family RecA-like ATPase